MIFAASYKAWMRNNGTHYTLHYGYNCWNTELLYEMNKTLPAQWDVVEKNFRASLTDLEHSIKQDFFTLTRQLQGNYDGMRRRSLRDTKICHRFSHTRNGDVPGQVEGTRFLLYNDRRGREVCSSDRVSQCLWYMMPTDPRKVPAATIPPAPM